MSTAHIMRRLKKKREEKKKNRIERDRFLRLRLRRPIKVEPANERESAKHALSFGKIAGDRVCGSEGGLISRRLGDSHAWKTSK